MQVDRLWRNARLARMAALPGLGVVERGAVAAKDGRIAFAGPETELPAGLQARETIDCEGRWITPGLIDCHTHLVFAGDRSDEFERRLAGESYADIARSGGGIAATVRATRQASEDALVEAALPRLEALMAEGVTTVEIKSGYGLETEAELRQLRAARRLGEKRPVSIVPTYLGAHAAPPGGDRAAYLRSTIAEALPRIAAEGLAEAVDAFHETIAFTAEETSTVLEAARRHGLPVKLHADQLADNGGAALAARFSALSADHLEYTSEEGAAAMGRAGTVAVILPGAFYVLKETRKPPVEAFRRHGVPMAVATDLNPGTSPIASLRLCAHMACTFFGLTVPEALLGITRHAAQALGHLDEVGTLERDKRCDLAIWNIEHLAEIIAWIGPAPLHRRVWRGM
ncbi:MAG TPA: imidazolonepropionase [Beijerinckiaceae bacterium]|nr:imidazolonepropionase [Beijerinckiaceae bacterium]